MTTTKPISCLFANNISRRIEEVIKVDQADETIIRDELSEYVVTDSIRGHLTQVLERYWETPNKPHDGVGVWVSGFFGSGKSSFAKYLGLALENHSICGQGAAHILGQRTGDNKVKVLLGNIAERLPTQAVIFDLSTDRSVRSGNDSIIEIMYKLLLRTLGYSGDLDLSELEITLEEEGRLVAFKAKYQEVFGKDWDVEKGKIVVAVQQASRVMHELEPDTYATTDSWRQAAAKRADVSAGDLAKRAMELMGRRSPGKTLVFVVDEVGQFVARDVSKMLELQGVVQSLGRVGRGKLWLVVTSQEKLTELVSGLDDKTVELARLMDRFPTQVHLEPSDISEVTSKRVLSKNAEAEKSLRELFQENRGRLAGNTRLTADIKLPELTTEAFIDLYPLLPYQIDLIIQVVSGLRTQGGASKHVGGANRTIIKLAQQLLIHPDTDLQSKPVGILARIDQVYDLVSGNIGSEVRGKIDDIGKKVDHPLAQAVAKAICLLQYVRSIHRTAENIAATLHPAVDADSRLPEVKAALVALEKAHMVRQGDGGYRIPTPAEDDWERQRAGLSPKPGDVSRLHAEVVTGLWQPPPSHNFLDVKTFKAALFLGGRQVVDGDIPVHMTLAESGRDVTERVEEVRKRSQTETKAIFWVSALDDAVDRETVEVFRSKEILSRKERGAQTKDETSLVAEEKLRLRRHQDELRRLIKQALLNGTVFFRGNDRSPDEGASDVGRSVGKILAQTLPEVFDRFEEAAARVGKKDLDSLMTTESLRGLTPLFTELSLVRDQGDKPVFNTEHGPLAELLARIENRASYGEVANGRYLADEFAKEPFGWDFDMVRLLVIALLRAGKVEATSKGQVIESALSLDAHNTFQNNNLFRQASFRPKVNDTDMKDWADAAQAFADTFGKQMPDISNADVVAASIRTAVAAKETVVEDAYTLLRENSLPGADILRSALDQMRSIRLGKEDHAIVTFNAAYRDIKEAVKRSAEVTQSLTETHLMDLRRAKHATTVAWPFLSSEPSVVQGLRTKAEALLDLLAKDSFFRELPAIDQHSRALEVEYGSRLKEERLACSSAYASALVELKKIPGWSDLSTEIQNAISAPLTRDFSKEDGSQTIPNLRSEREACQSRLHTAIQKVRQAIDGDRLVTVEVRSVFVGGIETEEQLELALDELRQHCLQLIGRGKKVVIQ